MTAISETTYETLRTTPINWCPKHIKIIDKNSQVQPLVYNKAQIIVARVKYRLRKQGRQVKLIILKARQQGITTEALGEMFCDCNTKPFRRGLIVAHKTEAAIDIFNKARFMQDNNPDAKREQRNNRKEITYAPPHYSMMQVGTAGDRDLGRGGTVQFLHCSELAFWPDASQTLNSVMQCLPREGTSSDVTIVYESTANGAGGEFWQRWRDCTPYRDNDPCMTMPESNSEFIGIFLPWHRFPEYTATPKPGFRPTTFNHINYGDESVLKQAYQLDDGQLQWRRTTIMDYCGGDIDMFRQEYPSNDREAFLFTGRPVFNLQALDAMSTNCSAPHYEGVMEMGMVEDDDGQMVEGPVFRDRAGGWIKLWELPRGGVSYVIGADTSEGLDPEEANDPDAHSAHVMRVDNRAVVGKVDGHFDPDIFARQLAMLGGWFNDALIGVEVNNTSGGAVRQVLKDEAYPNLYYRKVWDKTANQETERLGWETNKITRGILISDLGEAIREHMFRCWSKQTIYQLCCFVYNKDGKPTARQGEHDDDVISLGITWQMAIYAALHGVSSPPEQAGELVGDDPRSVASIKKSGAFIGGFEEEDDEGDWEEDEYY